MKQINYCLNLKKYLRHFDNAELISTKIDGTKYDFNCFFLPLKFFEKIHNYEITLDEAWNYQAELRTLINKLNNDYNPRIKKKIDEKNNVLKYAKKLLDATKDIIVFFEKGTFPYKGNVFKTKEEKSEDESEEESEKNKLEKIKDNYKKFIEYIENESKGINYDLFKDYFYFVISSTLAKKLYETKDKKKNNRWSDLKDEIEKMYGDEKEAEKPDKILEIVERNSYF